MKRDSGIEGKDYFVYKIITCPIRANILDVCFKLKIYIMVLTDLVIFFVKAWYLCKGHFAMKYVSCASILKCEITVIVVL